MNLRNKSIARFGVETFVDLLLPEFGALFGFTIDGDVYGVEVNDFLETDCDDVCEVSEVRE